MGEATFILGIDIKRDRANRSVSIGQSAYVNTLLTRHGMAECNPSSTPMDSGTVLELIAAADGYKASITLIRNYQSIIGGLMFAAICTRPDIAFAVSRLSRYCSNLNRAHLSTQSKVRARTRASAKASAKTRASARVRARAESQRQKQSQRQGSSQCRSQRQSQNYMQSHNTAHLSTHSQ